MKKVIILLVFAVFLSGLVSAQVQTNYYVYEKDVFVEHKFENVLNLELRLPYDVNNLKVSSEYELEDIGNHKILKIESGEEVSISYITQSMIEKTREKYYFISRNYFDEAQDVKLVLPEGAILVEEGILFPKPESITSDGRSVSLRWENYEENQILVDYEFIKETGFILYIVLFIVIFVFILYLFLPKIIFRKGKRKKASTKNIFGDEKRIIEYLLDKKDNECWTKEISKDLGISKVKLSRKLRSLEQKELIKKIPYGNENRIKLLKNK